MASTVVSNAAGPDLPSRIHDALQNYVDGCEISEFFSPIAYTNEAEMLEKTVSTVLALIKMSAPNSEERKKCLVTVQSFEDSQPAYSRQRLLFKHVLIRAADQQIIVLKSLFENLLRSVDLTLTQPIDNETISYIHQRLADLDYKTVRDIFKILIDKMSSAVPINITPLQKRRFDPIERLIVDIADRERNYLPAYFVMNELNRLTSASQIHICFGVWRIAEKFAQVTQSFRPLAEITCIIGRPFLLPIFGHLAFNPLNFAIDARLAANTIRVHYGNASLWKLDPAKLTFSNKSPLPYAYEHNCAQSFIIYQLFRQPFSRALVTNICGFRARSGSEQPSASQTLTDIIGTLMHDAMIECEEQQKQLRPHWSHLSQLVAFSAPYKLVNVPRLLLQLKRNLSSCTCSVARNDVMWLLLELVVMVENDAAKSKSPGERLTPDDIQCIVDIYFLMYSGSEELTFEGGNLEMARAMAPTCLWIQLARLQQVYCKPPAKPSTSEKHADDSKQQQPLKLPPSIESQKSFIDEYVASPEKLKELQLSSNEFMLAVFINAFINEDVNLKKLLEVVKAKFEPSSSDSLPFSMQLCDALIWRAKNIVANALVQQFAFTQPEMGAQYNRMPPAGQHAYAAQIESVARLLSSIDPEYTHVTLFNIFQKTAELAASEYKDMENQISAQCQQQPQLGVQLDTALTASHTLPAMQKLYIYTELLTCRLPPSVWSFDRRCSLLTVLTRAMRALPTNNALFLALENCCVRHWQALSAGDCLLLIVNASAEWIDQMGKHRNPAYKGPPLKPANYIPQHVFGLDPLNNNTSPLHADVHRVVVQVVARSMQLLGADLWPEMIPLLGHSLVWPEATLRLFPSVLSASLADRQQANTEQLMVERNNIRQMLQKEYNNFTSPSDDNRMLSYFAQPSFPPVFFCIIWQWLWDRGNVNFPPIALRIVDKMPVPKMLANLEKLVDYLLPRIADQQYIARVVNVLEQMMWKYWLFPLERFLLAMVEQPSTDHELMAALHFISVQLQSSQEFRSRMHRLLKLENYQVCELGNMPLQYLRQYQQEVPTLCAGVVFAQYYSERYQPTTMHSNFMHFGEKLLPVFELLITKSIEVCAPWETVVKPLLDMAVPVLRFHAQPISFVYQTLFYYHSVLAEQPQLRAELVKRVFAACNVTHMLSEEMQSGAVDIACEPYYTKWVDALMLATEQQMPTDALYASDWRYNEFANLGARTLHVCLCELMALNVEPYVVSTALIGIVIETVWSITAANMLQTINAVALLLTALPLDYSGVLWQQLAAVIASDQVKAAAPIAFVRSMEDVISTGADSKAHRMLFLSHAVLSHATPALVNQLTEFSRSKLVPLVETEAQLLYAIRLSTPFMNRMQQERSVPERAILDLTTDIYEMLGRVDRQLGGESFEYEDTLCDLLYHLKYNFVGYGVEDDTMPIVKKLRRSLLLKLRYLPQDSSELADFINTSSPSSAVPPPT